MWVPVKSSLALTRLQLYPHSEPQKHVNTMKTVACRLDALLPHCVILWFLYTPSSPDDPAAHLSPLWVHKHIQHHIKEARVLWLRGWGFHEAKLQPSSTKPQTDHHITEILLWCVVVTSFKASHITDLPNKPPVRFSLHFPAIKRCTFGSGVEFKSHRPCLTFELYFKLVFAYISICSCRWYSARRGWGEWCWWLWLVLDWRREWRGGLDEQHQQSV